jgi:aminoglycoside 6-adenylyltransferase
MMHPQYAETIDQIRDWSRTNPNIEGVVIIGSQVRESLPADQWSDLDLMVLVNDPPALLDENGWLPTFGQPVCTFNEITPLHFTD